MPPSTLAVCPNPYTSLDEDGDPCGYVLRVDLRGLSARPVLLHARRVMRGGKPKVDFDEGATTVPDLPAYRRFLVTGQILAADEATARRAGIPWEPVDEALARHRAAALARFQADTGSLPSWAQAPAPTTPEAR